MGRRPKRASAKPIAQASYTKAVANAANANSTRRSTSGRTGYERHHIYTDHLGSANTTLNIATGEMKDTRFYPFGEIRLGETGGALDETGRGFTGHRENRGIGLTYMNARFYVSAAGRFATADTIVPDPTNPQAFNHFSYVLNNPLKFNDPSGHCAQDDEGGRITDTQAGQDCWEIVDYLAQEYEYSEEDIWAQDWSYSTLSNTPQQGGHEDINYEKLQKDFYTIKLNGNEAYMLNTLSTSRIVGYNADTAGLVNQFIEYATAYENAVEGQRAAVRNAILGSGLVAAEVIGLVVTAPANLAPTGITQIGWWTLAVATAGTITATGLEFQNINSFNNEQVNVSANVNSVLTSIQEINIHSPETVLIVNYD